MLNGAGQFVDVQLFVIPAQPNLLQVDDVRELIRKDQDRLQLRNLLLAGVASAPAAPAAPGRPAAPAVPTITVGPLGR